MIQPPKISVIIITYNQEKIIGRALDSLITQMHWLYEIVICDDCSTDGNWDTILGYTKQYPDLIHPFQNERNLGIFGNWESTWKRPNGNLIYFMAGDDWVCEGFFERVHEVVKNNSINCDIDSVSIYFDFTTIYPDGSKKQFSNKLIAKGFEPVSLKLRGLIANRTIVYSRKVLEQFKPVRKDIGIYADELLDIQIPMNSDKVYHNSFLGSVYNYGVGIASRTEHEDHWRSIILALKELEKSIKFSKNDKNWIQFKISYLSFYLNPTFKEFIKVWLYYLQSRNLRYEIDLKNPLRLIRLTLRLLK